MAGMMVDASVDARIVLLEGKHELHHESIMKHQLIKTSNLR